MQRAFVIRGLAAVLFATCAVVALQPIGGEPANAVEPAAKTEPSASSDARTAARQRGRAARPSSAEIEARRRERRVSSWPVVGRDIGPGTTGTVGPGRLPGNNVVPLTPLECAGLGGSFVETPECPSDDPRINGRACQVQSRDRNGNRVVVVVHQMCITEFD